MCRGTGLLDKSYARRTGEGQKVVIQLPWGLKRCYKCRITFYRDFNACLNMEYVALYQLYHDGQRPVGYFSALNTPFLVWYVPLYLRLTL